MITVPPPFRFRIYEISLKGVHSKVCVWGNQPREKDRSAPRIADHLFIQTLFTELQIPVAVSFKILAHQVIGSGCDIWIRHFQTQTVLGVIFGPYLENYPAHPLSLLLLWTNYLIKNELM